MIFEWSDSILDHLEKQDPILMDVMHDYKRWVKLNFPADISQPKSVSFGNSFEPLHL